MKTLTGSLLAAALIALAHPALSNPNVEEIVVTAKQPVAQILSDMTDEIVAETTADLRTTQPAIVTPVVHVELAPAPAPAASK
jgi:hypothetical protein